MAASHLDASELLIDVIGAGGAGKARGRRISVGIVPNTLMHPGLFDVPWTGRASGASKTRKTHAGHSLCDVRVHLHRQRNALYRWNVIAT